MPLTFIFGRPGHGKTTYILKDALQRSGPKYLLVPDQVNFEYEQRLIAVIPDTVAKNISVMTFKSLARKVFYETGGPGGDRLDKAGKTLAIYRILKENASSLSVFGKTRLSKGMANRVTSQIREFKHSMITPGELGSLALALDDTPALSAKLRDLSLVFAEYDKYLKEGFSDGEDELSLVALRLPHSRQFSSSTIYIDGFESFSALELETVAALMRNGNDIFLTVAADRSQFGLGYPVWETAEKTVNRFISLASENGIAVCADIVAEHGYRGVDGALGHLEQKLFSFSTDIYEAPSAGISLNEYQNAFTEIRAAAISIRQLVREDRLRYRDISLVVPDISGYANILAEIFRLYEIPYHIDQKTPLSLHPLAMYMTGALSALSGGYRYDEMAGLLKSAFSPLNQNDAFILENHVLAKGISGLRWYDASRFSENAVIKEAHQVFIAPLRNLYLSLKEDMTGKAAARSLYTFTLDSGIPAKLSQMSSARQKAGDYHGAASLAQAWTYITETIGYLDSIFGTVRLNLKDLAEISACAFREYSLATIPYGADVVSVGDLHRYRRENVRVLFIAGANEGSFMNARAENGMFSDSELLKLRSAGFDKVPDPLGRASENEAQLCHLLTRPDTKLYISCPAADITGGALPRSNLFSRIVMLFDTLKINREHAVISESVFDAGTEFTRASLISDSAAGIRAGIAAGRDGGIYLRIFEYLSKTCDSQACSAAAKGLSYSNFTEKIDSEMVDMLFGKQVRGSVTRLEKFRQCPFSFFMEYGLKAAERKIWEISAADAGSFAHEVLEKFQTRAFLADSGYNMEEIERILSETIAETVSGDADAAIAGEGVSAGIRAELSAKLLTTCGIIYENIQNSRFRPKMLEAEFGESGSLPPVILQTEDGTEIVIRGKIDRVDTYEEDGRIHVAVFDYKTGNKSFSLSDVYHGLDLQLPVYLFAVINGGAGSMPAGAFYFHVRDPVIKGEADMSDSDITAALRKQYKLSGIAIGDTKILDMLDGAEKSRGSYIALPVQLTSEGFSKYSKVACEEQFSQLFAHAKQKLSELASGIRSGHYPVLPVRNRQRTACEYCAYKKACQFEPGMKKNRYDMLENISDSEFWERIKKP